MNSVAYEELCRFFLAKTLGIDVGEVKSIRFKNPKRPNFPEYAHQIDLYWEATSNIAAYLHIANAKFRRTGKIDQPDVMLLAKVKEKVAAHKAFLITNIGFTTGAVAAAKDEGIALLVVQPNIEVSDLPKKHRTSIQAKLQEISRGSRSEIFTHQVIHKGYELSVPQIQDPPAHGPETDLGQVVSTNVPSKVMVSGWNKLMVNSSPSPGSGPGGKVGNFSVGQGSPITKLMGPIQRK